LLTASLWSWFGSQPAEDETFPTPSLLANQSLLLLLVLVNHCTQDRRITNPYRYALFTFNCHSENNKGIIMLFVNVCLFNICLADWLVGINVM